MANSLNSPVRPSRCAAGENITKSLVQSTLSPLLTWKVSLVALFCRFFMSSHKTFIYVLSVVLSRAIVPRRARENYIRMAVIGIQKKSAKIWLHSIQNWLVVVVGWWRAWKILEICESFLVFCSLRGPSRCSWVLNENGKFSVGGCYRSMLNASL